jgi:UDP-glucose 4-epimerase
MLSTTSPATADADPALDVRTNLIQSISLLQAAVDAKVKTVYFASTGGAIYGPQGHSTYSENDQTLPISPYGVGKLAIERYLEYFRRTHGLEYVVFRISNPYGPRQRPETQQGLIPIALRRVMAGLPVVRLGDGGMVRDYVYVGDVVSAISPVVDASPCYRVYNVGSGVGQSVNEVLDHLREVIGRDFDVEEQPAPASFVDRVVLDTSRFRFEFGEIAKTSLSDGIRATWLAMKNGP